MEVPVVAMLGPVSTWEDRGVAASGTLPNDWYTSRELDEPPPPVFGVRRPWQRPKGAGARA